MHKIPGGDVKHISGSLVVESISAGVAILALASTLGTQWWFRRKIKRKLDKYTVGDGLVYRLKIDNSGGRDIELKSWGFRSHGKELPLDVTGPIGIEKFPYTIPAGKSAELTYRASGLKAAELIGLSDNERKIRAFVRISSSRRRFKSNRIQVSE